MQARSSKRNGPIAALIAALMAVPLITGTLTVAGTDAAEPQSLRYEIEQLAWMAGHWIRHGDDGRSSEEVWLAPRGRLMPGLNREVSASGRSHFEFLRIEQRDDGRVVYVASPGGGPTTEFTLTRLVDQRAIFENPAHDFPRRLIYWREGDSLNARAEGEERGASRQLEYRWQLQQSD